MKNYIDSFMRYRFLLVELVKKGIKLKYRRSYLGLMDSVGTIAYNDSSYICIRIYAWK